MNVAVTKKEIASALVDRFGHVFERYERLPVETLPTGIYEIDSALQGFPRGAITEIRGAASSGQTSLLLSALSKATSREEICAVVDCNDTFDLSSAAKAGVDLDRILWIRCRHNLERAFKAVDMILHAGGFGFVALNLCDVPARTLCRIISSWWFRFRRAIEDTPTGLMVLTPITVVRSCAALTLELTKERAVWPSALSLVSDNGYSSFTIEGERGSHLALVSPTAQVQPETMVSHSHFLRTIRIRVNLERPAQWQLSEMSFTSRLQ